LPPGYYMLFLLDANRIAVDGPDRQVRANPAGLPSAPVRVAKPAASGEELQPHPVDLLAHVPASTPFA
jgi:hypothetical protein